MKYTQLTYEERIRISILIQEGKTQSKIASILNRNRSTLSRELTRNQMSEGYFPATAEKLADLRKQEASSIPRIDEEVEQWVKDKLCLQWSPEQITNRMEIELGESVSHEWIYQLVYQDKKEGGTLYLNLRWGRRQRKKRCGGS